MANAKEADYVGIGPLFALIRKTTRKAIGIEDQKVRRLGGASGDSGRGMTADRAAQVIAAGGVGVAVINAIFKGDDPERAARSIATAIGI